MPDKNIFSVIGGDLRQIYMINELVQNGHTVLYHGLESDKISDKATKIYSIRELMTNSDVVICPVPFTKDKINIFSLNTANSCTISELMDNITSAHTLIGGNIPKEILDSCNERSISVIDLVKSDDFSLLNAIATAEGTIAEAVLHSPINLHKSNCLVIGFGRCAKVLAKKLKGIDANVTVAARRNSALIDAVVDGYCAVQINDMKESLPNFDFIFNTVPALVLDESHMPYINKNATIIDIASAPGGVDFEAAKSYKISADIYPALPGKYSPKTSGEIIASVILSILKEGAV